VTFSTFASRRGWIEPARKSISPERHLSLARDRENFGNARRSASQNPKGHSTAGGIVFSEERRSLLQGLPLYVRRPLRRPDQMRDSIARMLTGMDALWAETTGDPNVRIAILDGPVDTRHPCFKNARIEEINILEGLAASSRTATDHATSIASIIFGQHGGLVPGIAPGCTGLIIPIFSAEEEKCTQLNLAMAITQAVEKGADVINISAGQLVPTGQAESYLKQAIDLCAKRNVLVVASAGNEGCDCLHVPASLPSVLAVGALSVDGLPLPFSNWGAAYQSQGILAPGEEILGAVPEGGTRQCSGTSIASAVVAGVAGLLISLQRKRTGQSAPHAVRALMLESASRPSAPDSSHQDRFLAGVLDIPRILQLFPEKSEAANAPTLQEAFGASVPSTRGAKTISIDEELNPKKGRMKNMEEEINSSVQTVAAAPERPGSAPANRMPEDRQLICPGASGGTPARLNAVLPSDCGCGGSAGKCGCGRPQLVYALGVLGFDLVNDARRDSLIQAGLDNPHDASKLIQFLSAHPSSALAITWTLNQESTPIYAISPGGAFAAQTHELLRQFLEAQLDEGVEQISVPGVVAGKTTLSDGQTVPVIVPEPRGLYCWTVSNLVESVAGQEPKDAEGAIKHRQKSADIRNFLERIYYEIRNLGATSEDRSMNFAATNAFQIEYVFKSAIEENLKLDTIDVEKSPICRPGSDCWDVKLTFFHPSKRTEQARHVYRFTVDVSDVIPVTVGKVRDWDLY
jgi:cyanobactin maturation PatA/PatG family protease